jgi:hypothetical protein
MRDIEEILKDKRIKNIWRNVQNDKAIQLKLDVYSVYNNKIALAKFTKALGWEHLSISFSDETPSWDFTQEMKELFWKDDEVCYQLHPTKDNYINNDEHCLHLWKPIDEEIPLPPPILVGFRKGHEEDKAILKQVQEELGNPMTDEEIDIMYQDSFNNK